MEICVTKTVLLAEDDPGHAALMQRSFEDCRPGDRLVRVQNGEEALDYLLRRNGLASPAPGRPDLVLLDINMPRMNGFEVLEEVRRHPPLNAIPFVVLTSSANERDLKRAYELGASSYLVKPYDYDRFERLVGDLGRYWLDHNRTPAA